VRHLFGIFLILLLAIFPVLVWAADLDLSNSANYDVRIDGAAAGDQLTNQGPLATGDVNGDGIDDLVVGTWVAGASDSTGSVWVIFGGPTLSGNRPLSTDTNYNIRYDAAATGDQLGRYKQIAIGDVNGDGLGDLILGSSIAESSKGAAYVIFSTLVDDVGATTGNVKSLATASSYNIKYVGVVTNGYLTNSGEMSVADVNGDGNSDLILGANSEDNNGADSGSVYVMFSTLVDDVGSTTGNDKPLTTTTNYNIRYDGSAASEFLGGNSVGGRFGTGDINGDLLGDLIIGSNTNKAYVMFSTLIDDVGATTGNDKPLLTDTNYNIRYDGTTSGGDLTNGGGIGVGDVNGDGLGDLILGSPFADLGSPSVTNSGAAWVMFSTLIDDVSVTTGNNLSLDTVGNYNIRYVGAGNTTSTAQSKLTQDGTILIGDVNDDGLGDLILGAPGGRNCEQNANERGSAFVLFSTLVDDVGVTTGNNKNVTTSTNYNICYSGLSVSYLTTNRTMAVGDVNGDSKEDLLLGSHLFDIGVSDTGALYVFYSTLVDDVGGTTGNIFVLSSSSSYSDRYNGGAGSDFLTLYGTILVSDLNSDGVTDLVLGARGVDSNGADSGSLYVFYAIPPNVAPDDPSSLGGHVSGAYTNDTTPTLIFTLSDPDVGDTVKYQIQIDDTIGFSSPVVDYTSDLGAQGAVSFTVGQAEGSDPYTAGSEGQTLADGDYYWQVKAIDENSAESSFSLANGGTVAFVVDGTVPTIPGTPSTATPTTDTTPAWIWDASVDAGSGLRAADTYYLQWSLSADFSSGVFAAYTTATTFTHLDDLTDGTWYPHAKAFDEAGNESGYSANGSVLVDTAAPTTPGTPATTSPTVDTTPTWSWTASTDVGSGLRLGSTYEVQWSQSSTFSSGFSADFSETSSFNHFATLAVGTWYLRVRSFDAVNHASDFSLTGSVIIQAPPSPPVGEEEEEQPPEEELPSAEEEQPEPEFEPESEPEPGHEEESVEPPSFWEQVGDFVQETVTAVLSLAVTVGGAVVRTVVMVVTGVVQAIVAVVRELIRWLF